MKTQNNNAEQSLILCRFTRECVEKQQLAYFLEHWSPDKLPSGPALRLLMDSMVFYLHGYEEDDRPWCRIPQVQAFCRGFFEKWPFWFFTANLKSPSLLAMVYSCLRELTVIEEASNGCCRVEINLAELNELLARGLAAMERLCRRAGMTESEICLRAMQVIEYFKPGWRAALSGCAEKEPQAGRWN
jgi:hypothetical protein